MGYKGEATKGRILLAAAGLFQQKGFHEAAMSDVCAVAGLSRGGLYRHFGSPAEIFSQLVEEIMAEVDDAIHGEIERGVPAKKILERLLARYQNEMLDRKSPMGLAIYEFYGRAADSRRIPCSGNTTTPKRCWRNCLPMAWRRGNSPR